MTFSTSAVCNAIRSTFTPVWESVSDTTVARFDLGQGEMVQGTIGGEIMLYFCRPDGIVFDAVPALQSPAVVLKAIERAAEFWNTSQGAPDEAIRAYNQERTDSIAQEQGLTATEAVERVAEAHAKLQMLLLMGSAADDAMATSVYSKTLVVTPAETVTVVEPGGYWLYALQVHARIAHNGLQTPMEWKNVMFEDILGQNLGGGGVQIYDPNSLQPMSLEPYQGKD